MIRELLLVHHTHTDIGYTHPQPVIFELHKRFIEAALQLVDASIHEPDDARFRWTCEVTGTTRRWWDSAPNSHRDRFLEAVARGQIEVAAMEWHLTPLADLSLLIESLKNVAFFRQLGIPVRSAMNTDMNGVPWGLVEVLLDHGIDGFSMSANSHMGGPVKPRPGAFRWAAPDGREITVWNGFQYWHAANLLFKLPSSVEEVAEALPRVVAETEARGYPLAYLPLQITNPHHPDNAAPDPTLTSFVTAWNATNPQVRIRTVLLSEIFDRLRNEDLPTVSGDWTDYWNFGAGSSARETAMFLQGQQTLNAANQLSAWPGDLETRETENLSESHAHLALYAEHTWGADCSISLPESIESRMQWASKSAYAFQGLGLARIVQRDALHRLAVSAGGDEPSLLLYNAQAFPIRRPMLLPLSDLDWALTPGVHHRQRLDSALGNLGREAKRWCMVDLPALGYHTYPVSALQAATSHGLSANNNGISNSRVAIEFLAQGGVGSLCVDDVEYVGLAEPFTFGVPILERPSGGSRREIMKLDFTLFEPANGWQRDWKRTTTPGQFLGSTHSEVPGAVEYKQTFLMENGDRVEILYRLFADDPTIDTEVTLTSNGDPTPYSLALPFTLPDSNQPEWHFDTAGAIVEFDKEQLPNAARHFVTSHQFVRMQTEKAGLSIATPDLPLWKFGGMFFDLSERLNATDRKSVMLAWLSNNYWEVNFVANQVGQTVFRMRLLPHAPEPVASSYTRALPFTHQPVIHGYRELGPLKRETDVLLTVEAKDVSLESVRRDAEGTVLVWMNLTSSPQTFTMGPGSLKFDSAWSTRLDGTPVAELPVGVNGTVEVSIAPRAVTAVRLT